MLAASVLALLTFAGQAAAAEGMGGFNLPFCGLSTDGVEKGTDGLWNACTTTSLISIAGVIAVVALAVDNNDHSKSA
jgi:hypothetical protein